MLPTIRSILLFTAGMPVVLALILYDPGLWWLGWVYAVGWCALCVLDAASAARWPDLDASFETPAIGFIGEVGAIDIALTARPGRSALPVRLLCDLSGDADPLSAREVLLQAGGALKLGEGLQAALGSFDEDVGADSELTVSWHLSVVEGEALISDVVVSRTDTVDAGRAEVGLGVEMGVEAAVPTSVEEFLARVQGLTLSASIGASDDLAAAWLEAAGLRDTLGGGTWALSATIALEASLDLDAVQFVAGVVAEALRASVAEDGLVDALLAWAACPLQSTPAEVVQLLATELAMDGDLSLTIIGEASQGAEGSVGDIEGSAEVTLDIEHDLLAMGAVVTTDHLSRVLRGDVSGARERALA